MLKYAVDDTTYSIVNFLQDDNHKSLYLSWCINKVSLSHFKPLKKKKEKKGDESQIELNNLLKPPI